MIAIRPSVFCFIGKLAQDLQAIVPMAIRRRLGVVPDIFAFVAVHQDGVDLKIGTRRPRVPPVEGSLQNRFWHTITFASATIGNIRVRTDALRRPSGGAQSYMISRGGPDIYVIQCLSDPLGWQTAFSIAEKVHERGETPPSAGKARGIFPLFHLPSSDEDSERAQALEGLRVLEGLTRRGVLFPSIVLDRVNRNGYPIERWEDLTELLGDFLSLASASEMAPAIWGVFPQVADLHADPGLRAPDGSVIGSVGLSSLGLARFRFSREALGEELGRLFARDLKRALGRALAAEPPEPTEMAAKELIAHLAGRRMSAQDDRGMATAEDAIVEWVLDHHAGRVTHLGVWSCALERLQNALFERIGDVAQRIENIRQSVESSSLDSPLKESWIARLSVNLPPLLIYLPAILACAMAGAVIGVIAHRVPLAGFALGGASGGVLGFLLGLLWRRRSGRKVFTIGEFPESAFTKGFPVPRTLEQHGRARRSVPSATGVAIQLWGELRSQIDPREKGRIDALKAKLAAELDAARAEEAELVFLDRALNAVRERVELWRSTLADVELWEPGRGFAGDVFPADGPRRLFEALGGREAAEAAVADTVARARPLGNAPLIGDLVDELSSAWGTGRAGGLEAHEVLKILDDRPEDLLQRLSEASAPLWPRPGDRDELLRCFGQDFAHLAQDADLRHSLREETVFIRVLGGVKSTELARA